MERNKRSYHVPRLVAVRLTVYIAANIKSNIFACFTLTFPTMRSYSNSKNSNFCFYGPRQRAQFVNN